MRTTALNTIEELESLESLGNRQAILKHNTTCPISKGVLQRLESTETSIPGIDAVYVLDLHANRSLSDAIATRFGVEHQSPQLLVIQNGTCQYTEWGYDISAEAAAEALDETGL